MNEQEGGLWLHCLMCVWGGGGRVAGGLRGTGSKEGKE